MKPVKFVRVAVGIYQHPLVRKSKCGIVVPWLMIKLAEHHGYIPENQDVFYAPSIAEDLGFILGVEPYDSAVLFIDGAINRAKESGLLVVGETRSNVGGRSGQHFVTIRGWTSPLYREMAKPQRNQTRPNVTQPKQTYASNVHPSRRKSTGKQVPPTRARIHTPLSNKISDPPGRDLWEQR